MANKFTKGEEALAETQFLEEQLSQGSLTKPFQS